MQQIAVNQMNGTSGGSLRQKLDLSDVCQATDAFAMLFMQLMGQTIQPEALLQMPGEQPLAQTDAVLPAAAGTVGRHQEKVKHDKCHQEDPFNSFKIHREPSSL